MSSTRSTPVHQGLAAAALLLTAVSPVRAEDAEHVAMARVRLSTESGAATGCARLGRVSDDSIKDLRRKIVRLGGNTGLLTFSLQDMSVVHADVFRCQPASAPPTLPPAFLRRRPGPHRRLRRCAERLVDLASLGIDLGVLPPGARGASRVDHGKRRHFGYA